MNIDVYTMVYNEEYILGYFFRHYQRYARKIVVLDNGSTDRTKEVVQRFGGDYRSAPSEWFEEDTLRDFKNNAWKESRDADWVVVVDADEFLWHDCIFAVLARYREDGVTVPQVEGWDMISEVPPSREGQIYDEIKEGVLNPLYSKFVVFNPGLIEDMGYDFGAHWNCPTGINRQSEDAELKLLHCSVMGREHFVRKYKARVSRLSPKDRARWDSYLLTDEQIEAEYVRVSKQERTRVIP